MGKQTYFSQGKSTSLMLKVNALFDLPFFVASKAGWLKIILGHLEISHSQMKVRHCWQVQNNQEKNILREEVNSRSLDEYEPCCIDASKKSSQWFMGTWFAFEKCQNYNLICFLNPATYNLCLCKVTESLWFHSVPTLAAFSKHAEKSHISWRIFLLGWLVLGLGFLRQGLSLQSPGCSGVDQADLELTKRCLLLPPEYWDWRCATSC